MEKLDQLELILKILFCRNSAQSVLRHCAEPPGIREEDYVQLAYDHSLSKSSYLFSKEDLRNQFRYFMQKIETEAEERGHRPLREGRLNPMDCLFYYVRRMLHTENNEVVCRYLQLLNWRGLTRSIGTDLPVAAYLSSEKEAERLIQQDMDWRMVLRHDNFQLQRIMERGISENHFHLYGSAPVFHLSWISLMNRLNSSKAAARLRKIDRARNSPETRADTTLSDPPMRLQHLQAAVIRLVLFGVLTLEEHPEFSMSILDMPVFHAPEEPHRTGASGKGTSSRGLHHEHPASGGALDSRWEQEAWKERLLSGLRGLTRQLLAPDDDALDSLRRLEDALHRPQLAIDALRDWDAPTLPDYALLGCPQQWRQAEENIFLGERWLLYQCLRRIYRNLFEPEYVNLFYAYLILKERIRHELIHTDDRVGFSHFQDYERRKFDLMEDSILRGKDGAAARAAVRRELLQNPNIRSLEIRISPFDTAADNAERLRYLDGILSAPENSRPSVTRNRFFYVLHFLKREDDWHETDPSAFYCRHYLLRRKLWRQTTAIAELRKRYPERAERVLGIDAASQEIGCRPEVFGTSFRLLHAHRAKLETSDEIRLLPQLRRTFHVGEDFLDITDGLRSIYEAIRFLGLESGDRLGHALALGVDVQAWYAAKNNVITLPLQDYLDNLAWLYHRLLKYQLADTMEVQEYLKREFSYWFGRLYQRHMSADTISRILQKYQQDPAIPREYRWNQFDPAALAARPSVQRTEGEPRANLLNQYDFDIFQYYRAWKLRGDDPELYDDGYFRPPSSEDPFEACRVNQDYPAARGSRYDPGVFLIHYYYHYSLDVRAEGERQIQIPIPLAYIDAVAKVQRAMQREIGGLGLGIECNPSSNVSIGTFKRFDQHPILRFYNRELEVDSKLLEDNPQLLVSINTDDQGIFTTALENEYALMACALEKAENPDGSKRYPRQRVYAWLDAVRKMGVEQTFDKTSLNRSSLRGGRFHITDIRRVNR